MMTMDDMHREMFLLHANTENYAEHLQNAECIIKNCLQNYKPYAAVSGGKDSMVMLHIILKYAPNIYIAHWDYGKYFIPTNIERQIIKNIKAIGGKNLHIYTSKLYDIHQRNAKNVLGKIFIGKVGNELYEKGYNAVFVGLRKEESCKRKRKILYNRKTEKIKEFYPLQNWSWLDVWAHIIKNNVPYLYTYDKYAHILGYKNTRMTTFFDKEFNHLGTSNIDGILMWKFKHIQNG